jgi:hypothetical protein
MFTYDKKFSLNALDTMTIPDTQSTDHYGTYYAD